MRVRFYATFRPLVGAKEADLPLPAGATVQDLLDALVARWPALREHLFEPDGSLSRRANVFVGGRGARWLPEGARTPLAGVDEVDVFPAVAGG